MVLLCSVSPRGSTGTVMRYLLQKPKLAWEIVRAFVFKEAATDLAICRRVFFSETAPSDSTVREYMEYFAVDSVVGLDTRTAVVTLTHDPKIDDPGLRAALASDAFYIGCLGSRRTHAARCERLTDAGFSEADLARLHGPVGLDIGARTPAEIAVSILAQMISVESGSSGATGL